jgi:hypothetical protein
MRKILLVLLFMFWWISVAVATTIPSQQPMGTWLLQIDSLGRLHSWEVLRQYGDHISAIIPTRAGGFAMAGWGQYCRFVAGHKDYRGRFFAGDGGGWLLITDSLNHIQQECCFHPDLSLQSSQAVDLCQLPDGRLVVAGWSVGGRKYEQYTVWLQWFTEWGQPLESHVYQIAPGDSRCMAIALSPDGGVVLAGLWYNKDRQHYKQTTGRGWILKADSAGQQEWLQFYGDYRWNMFSDIVCTPDSGFLAVGEEIRADSSRAESAGWVVKIDAWGDILDEQSLADSGGVRLRTLAQAPDGNFMSAGETDSHGKSSLLLIKMNGEGHQLWKHTYLSMNADDTVWGLTVGADGTCVLAGKTYKPPRAPDAFVVKTDVNGRVQWEKIFGCQGNDGFSAIAPRSGGGFLIAGYLEGWCTEFDLVESSR